MIDDDVEPIDELLRELGSATVTPPPWSAVVDRIAVAPARPERRIGWSAVLVGAVVALLVAAAGAVSEPVRETVFEPVANLLPWVDGGGDPQPAPDDPTPQPTGAPRATTPADANSDAESEGSTGADVADREADVEPEVTRTSIEPDVRPTDGSDSPDRPDRTDRDAGDEETGDVPREQVGGDRPRSDSPTTVPTDRGGPSTTTLTTSAPGRDDVDDPDVTVNPRDGDGAGPAPADRGAVDGRVQLTR